MGKNDYLDYDLLVESWETGYRARVLNSPAGQAVSFFDSAPLDAELPDPYTGDVEVAKAFGKRLFDQVFDDQVESCLRRSQDEANRQGAGLRIRLRLTDVPQLADLPWEYLYDPDLNRFLTLSTETPIVRYLDLPDLVPTLTAKLPLKMLVIVSSPNDREPLDVTREWDTLHEALGELEERGHIELTRLESATLGELQRTLRQGEYHILHFIGHGGFDEQAQDGVLVLEDEQGQSAYVSGSDLGTILHDHRSLRLVFLNACEGARASDSDPFSGVAQGLVQQGIPAVVAMQYPIPDQMAIVLGREFYTALSEGYPVDADLAEARKAVFAVGDNIDWGTPVLYMRSPDGRIFDFGEAPSASRVGDGFVALTDLMQEPAVREAVVAFRTDFEAAGTQIDILSDYKGLHDVLHTMQFHCYHPVVQESGRFPDDTMAVDNLMDYELTLQGLVTDLQGVAQRESLASFDTSWIPELDRARQELHTAVDELDPEQLKRAIWRMNRVLAVQPSQINTRLNEAARSLRLPALIEALTEIRDHVSGLDLDADKVSQFVSGVEALAGLDAQLSGLVSEHDSWQVVDLELRRIEAAMRNDTMELEMSWPSLRDMAEPLYDGGGEQWAESVRRDAEALGNALEESNPARIKRHFWRYRRQAGDRFYKVDVDLKNLCEEMRQVGGLLAGVLDMIG